jgi:hypothetical protein
MKERVSTLLRLNGFLLLMLALLQGFLIIAGVGKPEAQGRAHIEIFLFAFLILLIGQNVVALSLSDKQLKVLAGCGLGAVWIGAIHSIAVASTGATSIHVKGTASPALEKALVIFGVLPVPLGFTAIGLILFGLLSKKRAR